MIDQMEEECNAIKSNALKMAWYMRGGVGYNDIMNMSLHERKDINQIIESNLETTKTTKLPFF